MKRRRRDVGKNCSAPTPAKAGRDNDANPIAFPPRHRETVWGRSRPASWCHQSAAPGPRRLTLVARKAVVEVLALGRLVPLLRVGLLATAVATGARRTAAVTHGLATVTGGGLGLGATVARLLARTAVRACGRVSD